MKMNQEAMNFIAKWNDAMALDYEARMDTMEDMYLDYRENGKAIDYHLLDALAKSIHRGNDMMVITELGGAYDAERYSEFFKEYGIEKFAFCTKSTAAVQDIISFMHFGWEVSGYAIMNTIHGEQIDAIIFH